MLKEIEVQLTKRRISMGYGFILKNLNYRRFRLNHSLVNVKGIDVIAEKFLLLEFGSFHVEISFAPEQMAHP